MKVSKFGLDDHKRLAKILKKIKGKFLLSYYENELVRELYGEFKIITRQTSKHSFGITKTTGAKKKPKGIELLVMN